MKPIPIALLIVGFVSGCATTPTLKSVVGEYEFKNEYGNTYKYFFLENGIRKWYRNGQKANEDNKWSIVDGEIHIEYGSGVFNVYRINAGINSSTAGPIPSLDFGPRDLSESITSIARIRDGKPSALPKESQVTFIKIK